MGERGAFALEAGEAWINIDSFSSGQMGTLLVGFTTALVSGYLAITMLIKALVRGRFALFGVWCWLVGSFALWWFGS